MKGIISWGQGIALSLGGPGLFLIAFLDASFLSLPEINDILVMWMVTRHKERLLYYVSMATLGSLAGCFVLYWLAWKGGDAVMKKWFKPETVERATAQIRRYGVLALLVPSMLPPPSPFKVFVLLAGVVANPASQLRHRHRHRPRAPVLHRGAAGGLVRRRRAAIRRRTRQGSRAGGVAAGPARRVWSVHLVASPPTRATGVRYNRGPDDT